MHIPNTVILNPCIIAYFVLTHVDSVQPLVKFIKRPYTNKSQKNVYILFVCKH